MVVRQIWRAAAVAVGFLAAGAPPASAGSQCFKNLDDKVMYINLRYARGDTVVMRLKPGEKRRFDNVGKDDSYCYSSDPIDLDKCPNKNPVHMTSCDNPKLQ